MSQHDFNIANQSFPATRTDLNNALQALASNSSGDAEPSTTFANQWWYETDTNTLKLRNEANNAWLSFATVDQSTAAWTLAHDVIFGDNDKAIFGAGSDLQIYSDGNDSFISETGVTGSLYIDGTNLRLRSTAGDVYLKAVADGAVAPDELVANAVKALFRSVLNAGKPWLAMLKSCWLMPLVPCHSPWRHNQTQLDWC